ncbi:ribulose-phosphate 3-epimerase [Proteinivorax hydrogeniformans]|uniref:Ribulose-phosphate 3-epimerase n=1 Tax=Proteinivorax hydrogeniformans TaxID=1826727 RepID=A0AAU8HQI1_9FIRM
MVKIAPSLLAANILELKSEIQIIEDAGAHWLHIDVMDGHFVPNITFGPDYVKAINNLSNLTLDVHLMIENPELYIPKFAENGADIITVHYESAIHLHRVVQMIKSYDIKAGVAINPATNVENLRYILNEVDMILIMSVNPGFGGQKFIKEAVEKIKHLKSMLPSEKDVEIQIDGGVNGENASELISAGATSLVAGSYIFKSIDKRKAIESLMN